ncbi:zinc ribbon domain-containing protein [Acidocella aminolytica]|uniref:zinc ribbon domain-containing protein n=1 Tax=Acidocella aminolytica TaxID=33998 RepID=UPI000932A323
MSDFHDRFGIISEEVNPAYTSQTCSCCGYVDKRNRPSQSAFRCKVHTSVRKRAKWSGCQVRPIHQIWCRFR